MTPDIHLMGHKVNPTGEVEYILERVSGVRSLALSPDATRVVASIAF